jgi:uncharacterized membrane protein YkgB
MQLLRAFRRLSVPLGRISIFVIFFWFGILKVIGAEFSPATELIRNLFEQTVPFMPFPTFLLVFGLFECAIGILFIIPGCERVVIPFLLFHMATTIMPMFVLPEATWSGFLIPTLEGQYIIKNLLIFSAAIGIAAHLHPIFLDHKRGKHHVK